MSDPSEPQLQWRRLWVNVGYMLLLTILVSALLPATGITTMIVPYGDKIAHGVAFAFLMVWFGGLVPRRMYLYLFIAFVVYGGVIELLQNLTPYRAMELADLGADTVGLVIGWALLLLGCHRWPAVFESRFRRS
jgi:VanZ family protein